MALLTVRAAADQLGGRVLDLETLGSHRPCANDADGRRSPPCLGRRDRSSACATTAGGAPTEGCCRRGRVSGRSERSEPSARVHRRSADRWAPRTGATASRRSIADRGHYCGCRPCPEAAARGRCLGHYQVDGSHDRAVRESGRSLETSRAKVIMSARLIVSAASSVRKRPASSG